MSNLSGIRRVVSTSTGEGTSSTFSFSSPSSVAASAKSSTILPYSSGIPSSLSSSASSTKTSWCSTSTKIMLFLCFVPVFLCIIGLPPSSSQATLRLLRVRFDQEEQDSSEAILLILKLQLAPSFLSSPSPSPFPSPSTSPKEQPMVEFLYLRRDLDTQSPKKDLPLEVESMSPITISSPTGEGKSSDPSSLYPIAPFFLLRLNAFLTPLGGTKVLIRFRNPFAQHKLILWLKFSPLSSTLGEAEGSLIVKNPISGKQVQFDPDASEDNDDGDNDGEDETQDNKEEKEAKPLIVRGYLVLNPLEEFKHEVDLRKCYRIDWTKSKRYTVKLDGDFGDHLIIPAQKKGGGGGEQKTAEEEAMILELLRDRTRKDRPFQLTSGTISIS